MIQYLNQKKGQSTVEYAVLIIIIIAALLSIQAYIKRGVQGRLKDSADNIGDQYSVGNTNFVHAVQTNSYEKISSGVDGQGITKTENLQPTKTREVTKSSIVKTDQEYFGPTQ